MSVRTKNIVFALAVASVAAACTTTDNRPSDAAAKRQSIDADVSAALTKLYAQAPGSRELVAKAQGVLVFPSVVSAGFIVGASYGQGELLKGTRSAGYYSTTAGSVGLLAGADSKAVFVLFMTKDAYDQFRSSQGWTAGVDASVTLINMGANGGVDTNTAQAAVEGFVLNNGGLMANLSMDGTKFARLDI
jgi:lipid-binding SYLF domain-containing protein